MPTSKTGLYQPTRFTLISIAIAISLSMIVLAGWIFGLDALKTVFPAGPQMMFNTALVILFSGISLLLFTIFNNKLPALLLGILVFLLGSISLSEYLFSWNAGIDELFINDFKTATGKYPGRMSPITATAAVLTGISLLTYAKKKTIGLRVSEFAAIGVLLISFTSLIGYLYGSSHLYQIGQFTSTAINTALALLFISLAILTSRPAEGFIAAFNKKTNAARIGSREVPVLILVTVLVGWLQLQLQEAGLFDPKFGVSVMIITFAITFFFITWSGTKRLNRLEYERKNAELKILNNEKRFRQAFGYLGDNVWEHDFVTGKTKFAATINELLGYANSEISDNVKLWWNSTHPDDHWMLEDIDKKYRTGTISSHNSEYRIIHKDGSLKWVLDRGVVIEKDIKGNPLKIIGTHTDITPRRKYELALKNVNETLEKRTTDLISSNKELEQFAYIASHDLQEPLRMVSSFLQLLKKKYDNQLDETAGKYIHIAVDGADRMKILISDLLNFSRISTNKEAFIPVDLNESIKNVLRSYQHLIAEANAIIHTDQLPVVTGNASQMEQLFQNLVGNALKYRSSEPPQIKISSLENEKDWTFHIKDNGIGLNKNYAEKIFEIFQRLHTKSEYSGTGIGLAICKKIVERHGGQIGVDSTPGKGSQFFFTLPKKVTQFQI